MPRLYCPDFVTFLYLYGDLQIQFINHNAGYQQLFLYLSSGNYFAHISPLSAYHLEKYLVCICCPDFFICIAIPVVLLIDPQDYIRLYRGTKS